MIRLAVPEDFTSLMSIYAYARSFMQETGNPNQWGNHFPPEELIHNRIRDKQLFVLEENGTLHGAFAFIIGEDPTYLQTAPGSPMRRMARSTRLPQTEQSTDFSPRSSITAGHRSRTCASIRIRTIKSCSI